MFTNLAKKLLKKPLQIAGYDLVRKEIVTPEPSTPPIAQNHPLSALYSCPYSYQYGVAFNCDLNQCVNEFGFGYGSNEWNPFVAALNEYKADRNIDFESSILKNYYDNWQPENAKEVFFGNGSGPQTLTEVIPSGYVLPWSSINLEERIRQVQEFITSENADAGLKDVSLKEGYNHFGPVTIRKGQLELDRLKKIYTSISNNGYKRTYGRDGDIRGFLLERNGEYRFLIAGGYHRLAAVAALGYSSIAVRIDFPVVIKSSDVDYWPQIKRGVWNKKDAVRFFNQLFDFDSQKWAQNRDLLPSNRDTTYSGSGNSTTNR